jgi:CDP-diacylglycerol--serine O-phosphatidyltransferase
MAGLACSLAAIYFSILNVYQAAMIGMVWAVAFDWADGLIARKIKGRIDKERAFGAQLDVLIDIVSYGVVPAILLLSYGKFAPLYLVVAFVMLAAAAMRLSFFSTFGLTGEKQYTGLALDNNSLILVFVFIFESNFGEGQFAWVLAVASLTLAALNVSQIKTPKLSGNPVNVYLLAAYTLGITIFFGSKLI